MDDVLRRLGVIEKDLSDARAQVGTLATQIGAITARLPHMATKADVSRLPYMATKADVSEAKVSIIQWMVGTTIAVAGLAFAIAKLVH